jgi:hypothetical protein
MKKKFLMILLILIMLTACGKDKSHALSSSQDAQDLSNGPSVVVFRAMLRPLNNSLSGFIPTGIAEVIIRRKNVTIKTLLDDDASVPHPQSINQGSRCPNTQDDTNKDGIIDSEEAHLASGKVLIPLDGDLSSAEAGLGFYPVGSGFTYVQSTSLETIEKDTLFRTGEELNFSGRVVLIHGVSPITKIPSTTSNLAGMTTHASIPVACGVLYRQGDNFSELFEVL